MYTSLLFKEWTKTGRLVILSAVIFAAAGIYSFMKTGEELRLMGHVNYWETLLQKDIVFFTYFKYLPLLLGTLLAITQYVPEMQFKRLKLTLHLPLPDSNIIATMLAYGLAVTVAFSAVTLPLLLLFLGIDFPPEIVRAAAYDVLPWFLAGPAAYLLASWICLEPQWKPRIMYLIWSVVAITFYFMDAKAGANKPMLPYLTTFTVIASTFAFHSAIRFKEGKG